MKRGHGAVSGSLARRYARAVVELASDDKSVDLYREGLDRLNDVFTHLEAIPDFLMDRFVSLSKREAVVQNLAERLQLPPMVKKFFQLLVNKGRIWLLPEISREYAALQDQIAGVVRATVTVAQKQGSPMPKEIQGSLERLLKKKVEVKLLEDSEIIGGMSIRVGNLVYDGSVRTKLESLKEQLMGQPLAMGLET